MGAPKKREAPVVVNPELRRWTRGVSFTLAMGKTQVWVLVALHLSQRAPDLIGANHRALKLFVVGARGLQERGLVQHFNWSSPEERAARKHYRDFFRVTEAGEHVVALLKLSGIYDELRAELEAPQNQRGAVRFGVSA